MSSSGAPGLPPATPEAEAMLLAEPDDPSDRASIIARTLRGDRVWGSPGFPFDEAERRALIGRALDRCHCPDGVTRQYAAVLASRGRRFTRLGQIRVPVLVIHGTDDTLLPLAHGRDIAARIPGAKLVEVEGMGHDLEGGISAIIVTAVGNFVGGL
jgi:pimeloyl-ACP methyl ester carboxylesterase